MVDETVAIVEWPAEADRLDALRALGTPRLVVVAPQAATPTFLRPDDGDELEDWVRAPIGYDDVTARYARLARHAVALTHLQDAALR
jgi:hypothetical protein